MYNVLDYIDFICISLDFRSDRREKIAILFDELGISDRIHWWIVSKHPQGGIYGCFESHWCVWNSSEFKKPYLCVFEDDLSSTNFGIERFEHILNYVIKNCPQKFELLNLEPELGYADTHINSLVTDIDDQIIKSHIYSGFFFHTGCYIGYNKSLRKTAQKIRSWFGMDLDTALYKSILVCGCFPKLFQQAEADSDNDGGYRDIFNWMGLKANQNNRGYSHLNIAKLSPWMGWLMADLFQFLSFYIVGRNPNNPELIDRRIYEKIKTEI